MPELKKDMIIERITALEQDTAGKKMGTLLIIRKKKCY